jgi:transposase InsO family protein
MCDNYGIKAKPTTSHNPQANAIIERVHKVVNDMLRSFDLENNHENLEDDNPFDYFLQSTAWAIRSTYHTTLVQLRFPLVIAGINTFPMEQQMQCILKRSLQVLLINTPYSCQVKIA